MPQDKHGNNIRIGDRVRYLGGYGSPFEEGCPVGSVLPVTGLKREFGGEFQATRPDGLTTNPGGSEFEVVGKEPVKVGDLVRLTKHFGRIPVWVEGRALSDARHTEMVVVDFGVYGRAQVPPGVYERVYQKEASVTNRFQQNDIVRFVRNYGAYTTAKKGALAVVTNNVRDNDRYVAVRTPGGVVHHPEYTCLEKVEGAWHPLADYPGKLVEGEALVRPVRNLESGGPSPTTYLKHSVYPFRRYQGQFGAPSVALKANDPGHSWMDSNFEVFVEKGVQPVATTTSGDPSRAMAFAQAVEYAQKLNKATDNLGLYRVRQRSWDKQGLYAAVDCYDGLSRDRVARSLYRATECEEELRRIEESRAPVDIFVEKPGTYFRFPLPGGGYLVPPDNDRHFLWTRDEIQRTGGFVNQGGKRYRLCRKVTTRVEDAWTGGSTDIKTVPLVP